MGEAARIGCELFVVDDGWFGMRNNDAAGLGDWWVNQQKFPQGLDQLIDHVKSRGMKFGIWVEPESVNSDSELYRSHPDWIYRYPDAQPLTLRNQYLLNLSLGPVREYLWNMLHDLISTHDISFLKWDMNRAVTDMQSLHDGKGKKLWYGHVKAVYGLLEELRKAFPNLDIEACSGGGGRVDLGILRYAEQVWPSDNTDPYTRLFIQEGFTQFYPPAAMMCWVTDSPGGKDWSKRPLAYRFHSAMCGSLGIGADISKFSEEELEECSCFIKQYKAWRLIIQNGELYRLIPPGEGPATAVQYVSSNRSETLVFVFVNHPSTDAVNRMIKLQGLSHEVRYLSDTGETYAGSTLMNAGLCCSLEGDFASRVVYLKRLEG
jgi:alpha-galactosidase